MQSGRTPPGLGERRAGAGDAISATEAAVLWIALGTLLCAAAGLELLIGS